MRMRQGVQAEVLLSLALITFTATALLLAIFHQTNHARIDALHPLLARGFVAETNSPQFDVRGIKGGVWWSLNAEGHARGLASRVEVLDEKARIGSYRRFSSACSPRQASMTSTNVAETRTAPPRPRPRRRRSEVRGSR